MNPYISLSRPSLKNTYEVGSNQYKQNHIPYQTRGDFSNKTNLERLSQSPPIILCETGDRNSRTHRHRYLFYPSVSRLSPYSEGNFYSNFNIIKNESRKMDADYDLDEEINKLKDENREIKEDYIKRTNESNEEGNNYGEKRKNKNNRPESANNNNRKKGKYADLLDKSNELMNSIHNLIEEEEGKTRGPLGYYNRNINRKNRDNEFDEAVYRQKNIFNTQYNNNDNRNNRDNEFDEAMYRQKNLFNTQYNNNDNRGKGNNNYNNAPFGKNKTLGQFESGTLRNREDDDNNFSNNVNYINKKNISSKEYNLDNRDDFINNKNTYLNKNRLNNEEDYKDNRNTYSQNRNSNDNNNIFSQNNNYNDDKRNAFSKNNNLNQNSAINDINNNFNNNYQNEENNKNKDTNINNTDFNSDKNIKINRSYNDNNNGLFSTNIDNDNNFTRTNFGFINKETENVMNNNNQGLYDKENTKYLDENRGKATMDNNFGNNFIFNNNTDSLIGKKIMNNMFSTTDNLDNQDKPNYKSSQGNDIHNNFGKENIRFRANKNSDNIDNIHDINNLDPLKNENEKIKINSIKNIDKIDDVSRRNSEIEEERIVLADEKNENILSEQRKPFVAEEVKEQKKDGDIIYVITKKGENIVLHPIKNYEGEFLSDENGNIILGKGNVIFLENGKLVVSSDKSIINGDKAIPTKIKKIKFSNLNPYASVYNSTFNSGDFNNDNNQNQYGTNQNEGLKYSYYYQGNNGLSVSQFKKKTKNRFKSFPVGNGDARPPTIKKKRRKFKK